MQLFYLQLAIPIHLYHSGIQSSICVQLIETETQICKSVILVSQIADSMQTRRPAQHKQLCRTTCFGNP